MSHPLQREFESFYALIDFMNRSADHDEARMPTVALLAVIDILDEYWDTIENEEADPDFAGKALDSIYEHIHSILVHQTIPLTDEQRTAIEDQEAAEFRNAIEKFGEANGLNLTVENLDQKIQQALQDGLELQKEEETDDGL